MGSEDVPDPFMLDLDGLEGVPPLVQIRQWIGAALAHVADDHRSAVMLVCTELVSNAYEHGRRPRQIRLQHSRVPCRVRVEVDDMVPELPVLGRFRLGDHRGRGMIIVDKLSDWGVQPTADGKTVWAELTCANAERDITRCPDEPPADRRAPATAARASDPDGRDVVLDRRA